MRLLCVGRHAYLSEHLCRYFRGLGADCMAAVGASEALGLAARYEPHVIVCDCDLITPTLLDEWTAEPGVADVPLLAVSLTRRPEELPPVELLGVAGVLYLPALERSQVLALLAGAHRRSSARRCSRCSPVRTAGAVSYRRSAGSHRWPRSPSPHADRRDDPVRTRRNGGVGALSASASQRDHASIEEMASATSLDGALDLLDTGVLLLSHDLRVTYANARWTAWRGAPIPTGAPLATLVDLAAGESLQELKATLADGQPRNAHFTLRPAHADTATRFIGCTVRRVGAGLVLEARGEVDDDQMPLYDVARRLAEVVDMAEVLRTLCDIASRQCHGTGAAVLRMTGKLGEVVAAVGNVVPARGRCFELEGSMLAEALDGGDLVHEENFSESGRPLMRAVPELTLGPILVAPLRAHGETLGVLAVTRGAAGMPFTPRERARLRVLADHAALAVHKSLLLQQAQSADRAKGRFLATMSHELRTPLTALAGYGELLADQVIGPMSEPQLDILERMRSVTNHLSAMIEEILAFTSLEEGREMVRPSEFLAEDLVRSALAVVEPMAEQRGITLDLKLRSTAVRMTSDIDKARQILVNLLGNAVKFTDRGRVTLRLAKASTSARIDIEDTGIGIPADELPRLFRPFAQVDTGLTRRHGGTGLGLYISRRLATMLGGHIEVASEPGVGSTFSVVLPLEWHGPA